MAKVTSDWPAEQPQHRLGRNDEDAIAEALRQVAANNLLMWGHLTAPAVLAENTAYPPDMYSPATGWPGHTHGGGRDGRPLFRSICTVNPGNGIDYAATGLVLSDSTMHFDFDPWRAEEIGDQRWVLPIWVPGCDPMDGAYNNLAFHVYAQVTASTNVHANDTLDLVVTNLHPDSSGSATVAFSGITTTGTHNLESVSPHVAMRQGQINPIEIALSYDPDAAASATTRTLRGHLHEIEFGVYRTI